MKVSEQLRGLKDDLQGEDQTKKMGVIARLEMSIESAEVMEGLPMIKTEQDVVVNMQEMVEESLSQETLEKWNEVKAELIAAREQLN